MSITMNEQYRGRAKTIGVNPRRVFNYQLRATAGEDEDDITDFIASNTDAVIGTLSRQLIELSERHDNIWEARVEYGPFEIERKPDPKTGDVEKTFSVGTDFIDTKVSKETVQRYATPGNTAPDHKGMINVDPITGDSTPQPILIPTFEFQETRYIAEEDVTDAYKGDIFRAAGTTNDAAFKGFEAGEVLFVGAIAAKRSAGDYQIQFQFQAQRNRDDIVIGDIVDVEKKGWEYLWVQYGQINDGDNGVMKSFPQFVFVERMYDGSDFSDLGIGTT